MKRTLFAAAMAIAIAAIAGGSSGACAATAAATFVSSTGTNAGVCPATAPCATLQFAMSHTSAGGVVNIVSSGDFGPLTVDRSVSVVAHGVTALIRVGSISCGAFSGAAVCIDTPANVRLEGLTIDTSNVSKFGIVFAQGGELHVRNCLVRTKIGFDGLLFVPSASADLFVDHTTFMDSAHGIVVSPAGAASVQATFTEVRALGTASGIALAYGIGSPANGTINATLRRSSISGLGNGTGIDLNRLGGTGKSISLMVDETLVSHFGIGINGTGGDVNLRMGHSTISGTSVAVRMQAGATLTSFPNNMIVGNDDEDTTVRRRH